MNEDFKIGDIVYLKCGSHPMCVSSWVSGDGVVQVTWAGGGNIRQDHLMVGSLTKVCPADYDEAEEQHPLSKELFSLLTRKYGQDEDEVRGALEDISDSLEEALQDLMQWQANDLTTLPR